MKQGEDGCDKGKRFHGDMVHILRIYPARERTNERRIVGRLPVLHYILFAGRCI
jgi:uncharacterized protein YcsI (UPF0317 family)